MQGVVYVLAAPRDGDGILQRAASYACLSSLPATLSSGQGMLGQCAIERRLRVIELPDDSLWEIRSGLGAAL